MTATPLFVVQQQVLGKWIDTTWTNSVWPSSELSEKLPIPVDSTYAQKALMRARQSHPNVEFRLREVTKPQPLYVVQVWDEAGTQWKDSIFTNITNTDDPYPYKPRPYEEAMAAKNHAETQHPSGSYRLKEVTNVQDSTLERETDLGRYPVDESRGGTVQLDQCDRGQEPATRDIRTGPTGSETCSNCIPVAAIQVANNLEGRLRYMLIRTSESKFRQRIEQILEQYVLEREEWSQGRE